MEVPLSSVNFSCGAPVLPEFYFEKIKGEKGVIQSFVNYGLRDCWAFRTKPSGGSWSLKASTRLPRQQAWRVLMSPASASPVQGKVHKGTNSATSHRVVVVEEWKAFLSTKNT